MAYDKLKDENYENFGGINVKVSDYVTGKTEVLDLRNYTFVRPGKWVSRPGVQVSYSLPVSTFTLAPRSNIQYVQDNGASYQFFDSGATLYLRGSNTAVSGSLSVGATSPLIDYVVQNNYLYYTNGFAFNRLSGTSSIAWNTNSYSSIAKFNTSLIPTFADGFTFNLSLIPLNGATVTISILDFPSNSGVTIPTKFGVKSYSFGGFRNSFTLQTVGYNYKTFLGDETGNPTPIIGNAVVPMPSGFSLPGAPTFVGMGRCIIYGFSVPPSLGISALIVQRAVTFSPTAGTSIFYYKNVKYSNPIPFAQAASYGFGASAFEVAVFDYFDETNNYDFTPQETLNLYPKYLQTYNNMLFMANIVGQTTTPVVSDQPSTVYYSNLATPEQVDPQNFFEIRAGNGDVITAMCNYQTNLLIFKKFSVHEVSGSSPETLSLSDLTLEYGCVNNRAVVAFENRVWFVDPNYIVEYNGSSFKNISDKIKVYLDLVDLTTMSALHVKKNNQVWFSSTQKTFAYDYEAEAWSIFDNLSIDANAGPAVMSYGVSTVDVTYWQSGASFHNSVRFNDSLTTDFGLPITLAIKTRFHKRLGDSTQELWRRFFLNTSSSGTSMSAVTLNFYPDYGSSVYLQRNFTISNFQQRIDFGISAKALSIEILIQSSQSLSVNGYTVESRYLRSV